MALTDEEILKDLMHQYRDIREILYSLKEYMKDYMKDYKEKNKALLSSNAQDYYQKNKASILSKAKDYAEKNKSKIAAYQKVWAEKNKERLKIKRKEKHKANYIPRENFSEKELTEARAKDKIKNDLQKAEKLKLREWLNEQINKNKKDEPAIPVKPQYKKQYQKKKAESLKLRECLNEQINKEKK
jgi:hypothetical protein